MITKVLRNVYLCNLTEKLCDVLVIGAEDCGSPV